MFIEANYAITAKQMDEKSKQIVALERRKLKEHTVFTSCEIVSRQQVIDDITRNNQSYKAAVLNPDSQDWVECGDLRVVIIEGEAYIRSIGSDIHDDRLGGLPEF